MSFAGAAHPAQIHLAFSCPQFEQQAKALHQAVMRSLPAGAVKVLRPSLGADGGGGARRGAGVTPTPPAQRALSAELDGHTVGVADAAAAPAARGAGGEAVLGSGATRAAPRRLRPGGGGGPSQGAGWRPSLRARPRRRSWVRPR